VQDPKNSTVGSKDSKAPLTEKRLKRKGQEQVGSDGEAEEGKEGAPAPVLP